MVLFSLYKPRYQKEDWLFFLLLLLTQLKNLNPVSTTLIELNGFRDPKAQGKNVITKYYHGARDLDVAAITGHFVSL